MSHTHNRWRATPVVRRVRAAALVVAVLLVPGRASAQGVPALYRRAPGMARPAVWRAI